MFGLSFAKILLLAAVITAVWFGLRWLQQLGSGTSRKAGTPQRSDVAPPVKERSAAVEDLTACPRCRDYVSARAPSACGRGDCPYPRAR